jgi:hypothetical protein
MGPVDATLGNGVWRTATGPTALVEIWWPVNIRLFDGQHHERPTAIQGRLAPHDKFWSRYWSAEAELSYPPFAVTGLDMGKGQDRLVVTRGRMARK